MLFITPMLSMTLETFSECLPPANEVCEGYVLHVSVTLSMGGGGGWYPNMHSRWYPSMPCSSGGWYPSMHSRWYPSMPCSRGVSRPTPRGVSRPTLGGVSRPTPRGLQAHTQGRGLQAHTRGRGCIQACTEADLPLPMDGHCPGRHVSYWNAFLSSINFF